jgi:hypothetical protein
MHWMVWTAVFLMADFMFACALGKAVRHGMVIPRSS